MLSFHDLLKTQFGGRRDAAAFLLCAAGGVLTLPLLLGEGYLGLLVAVVVAAGGGALLGKRLTPLLRISSFQYRRGLELNSSIAPDVDPDGVCLGYIGDRAEPLVIPLQNWLRHCLIAGQSGVGKTVLGAWMMFQQIAKGGGLLWVDGKLDPANLKMLWLMANWCGRGGDLLVINPGNPILSNTYNPVLSGEADEVAGRCLALIPDAGANAGAAFYRQSAGGAVAALVRAIQATGLRYDFADLRMLLTNARALEWLLRELKARGKEDAALAFDVWLDQYRHADRKTGLKQIDLDAVKNVFGGIGSQLMQFAAGGFGEVMNTYAPEVDLFDAVTQHKIVYVMLPTMGKSEAASALGKLVVGDFRTAIARVQALPEPERPSPPFSAFFDEAGSYVTQAWSRMFEQARSAHLVMCPAFQTRANLEVLGEELLAMVAGNANTKVFFKIDEPDTQKWAADVIGKEDQLQQSVSTSASASIHAVSAGGRISRGATTGYSNAGGYTFSASVRPDYKVRPEDFKRLHPGECVVQLDGEHVYKVHPPKLSFDDDFIAKCGAFRLNRPQPVEPAEGLNLLARAREFLSE